MSGKRAKSLRKEARRRGRDGSVVIAHEYTKLKRSLRHPSYAPVPSSGETAKIKFKSTYK